MLAVEEVAKLLSDIESDRIERTISTTNTDKFGQAICAFANDLPNHNLPGYLIIGADDKTGNVDGKIRITDQLLQNLGGIKTDGKLQPQVSMTVEKVSLDDGDVAVVTVQPCHFTPVRYEGRIWVRTGPNPYTTLVTDRRKVAWLHSHNSHVTVIKRHFLYSHTHLRLELAIRLNASEVLQQLIGNSDLTIDISSLVICSDYQITGQIMIG